MSKPDSPPVGDLDGLKALFGFTDDDLAANRAGQLSARQRALFEAETLQASISKAAATIALPVLPIVTLLYFVIVIAYGDALGPGVCLLIIAWFAVMAFLFAGVHRLATALLRRTQHDRSRGLLRWLGRLDKRIDRHLAAGVVESVRGAVTFPTDGEHTYLMVDDEEFTIDVAAEQDERLWRLAPGQTYTLYFVPELQWIASIEPHREAPHVVQ